MPLAQATGNPPVIHFFERIADARIAAGWRRLKDLNSTEQARQEQVSMNRAVFGALKSRDAVMSHMLVRKHLGSMVASVSFQQDS